MIGAAVGGSDTDIGAGVHPLALEAVRAGSEGPTARGQLLGGSNCCVRAYLLKFNAARYTLDHDDTLIQVRRH